MPSVAISVSVSLEVAQQLADEARRQRRPISRIVCAALLAYLPCTDTPKTVENGNAEVGPDGDE